MGEKEGQASNPAQSRAPVSPLAAGPSSQSLPLGRQSSPRQLALRWLFHRWARLTRGMTMGVRALVIDAERGVFLVRHTYVPGWHLPGGGIEPGQCAREALEMELAEEGHIRLTAEPVLFGLYQNRAIAPRDHVALYVVRHFVQERPRRPDHEIAEAGFFALDALPRDTTLATRRRLEEVNMGQSPPAFW